MNRLPGSPPAVADPHGTDDGTSDDLSVDVDEPAVVDTKMLRPSTAEDRPLLGGRYRLLRRIGSGGMATIYLATDASLERAVAVKVLHAHLADDPVLLERFRVEGRHAASLAHPNIVGVFDQGVDDLPYIVMEHVDGPSLREVLLERGSLSAGEALAVLEPVCRGLARAHAAGVVHRDVKPENVLVAADGTPKVADFGIARAMAATSHTQTGTLVGSVHYMAPELVDGREATPASDQYAVGVLLYELLTGDKPLPADSPMAVALRHAREDVPPPSLANPSVAPAVDAVVLQATARDAAERFDDLLALAEAFREAVPRGPEPVTVVTGLPAGHEGTLVIPAETVDTTSLDTRNEVDGRREVPPPESTRKAPASALDTRRRRRRGGAATRPRRRRGLRALVAVVLLLLLGTGAWASWNYAIAPVRQVPLVTDADVEGARALLAELGYDLDVAERRFSREVPVDGILAQDPTPGTDLRAGRAVDVVLSDGPAPVEMPSVMGSSRADALAELEGEPFFFSVRVDEAHSDVVPAGEIAGQAPEAGTELRQDDEVIVNVSLGVEQVEVPDLAGLDRQAAEAALTDARLTGAFQEVFSDEVPTVGQVISQSVEPAATVDKGSTVEVVVSAGPATLTVPDVLGEDLGDAVGELEAMGFDVAVIEQERPRIGPFRRGSFGRVEYQDPEAGTRLDRGARVTLYTFSEAAESG